MNSDLRYYVAIFLRRLPIFIVIAAGISAAAIALAVLLPTVYTSNARLLVETPQIRDTQIQLRAPEQLQIIEQRLLTRTNLLEIAREFDVFEGIDSMSPDTIVRQMRANTEIRKSAGRDSATLMTITFHGRTGRTVSSVISEYVTRIEDENIRQRINLADGNLDFFDQEVERLASELDLQSARIVEFQNANSEALPDSLDFRLTRQTSLEERVSQMRRDRTTLTEQRERLIQVYEATGQINVGQSARSTPEERQLAQAIEELAAARTVFSDTNQKVKLLVARVEQLQAVVNSLPTTPEGPDSASILDLQLAEIDARTESIDTQISQVSLQLAELEESIGRTPANSIALESMQREYNILKSQHNQAVQSRREAEISVNIERRGRGQKITVIENAATPTEPSSPNRPLIALGGSGLGLAAGAGLIFLMEFLNGSIRRPVQLTKSLGITPIATIPYMQTSGQVVRKRILILLAVVLFAAAIVGALLFVHFQYLPLDLLWSRFIDRLGV